MTLPLSTSRGSSPAASRWYAKPVAFFDALRHRAELEIITTNGLR
jgi:hypothetical protein